MKPMRALTILSAAGLAIALAMGVQARPAMQETHRHHHAGPPQPAVPWSRLDSGTQHMLAPLKPRWDQLSPHAQHHLMDRAKQWERLPEHRQRHIRRNIQRWQQMTPAERKRVRTNERIYERLTPQQRSRLHEAYERFKQMPPAKQKALRRQWHHLSPAQREQWIRDGAKGDLPPSRDGANGH